MANVVATLLRLPTARSPSRRINLIQGQLREGAVSFGDATKACVIRHLSHGGACLEFAGPPLIPDMVTVTVKPEGLRLSGHVIWRSDCRVGIRFL